MGDAVQTVRIPNYHWGRPLMLKEIERLLAQAKMKNLKCMVKELEMKKEKMIEQMKNQKCDCGKDAIWRITRRDWVALSCNKCLEKYCPKTSIGWKIQRIGGDAVESK